MSATSVTNVHVINHTHWDREWFTTSVYTSRWIPGLIDKLEGLVAKNPEFHYLFDGQTLVVEDLLEVAPEYADKLAQLVTSGRLIIGPYYCQPDWQLTGGELLIRNLLYGQADVRQQGGAMDTGWLVDTFGHISQAPQIHQLFGIESVFVWRGVPELEPYFQWQAPDGSELLTINLFGGYRNLYGVSHAPAVAHKRLYAEVDKLRPFYPTAEMPLFDGYDLEDNPEDPMRFYSERGALREDVCLQESTPITFAQAIAAKELSLPTLSGELNSGKFGATFPGTFSARTYLKVMARDCEQMLFQICEPLATMAYLKGRPYPADRYEQWGRQFLQNAVHDCICGVSVDQVHEKMEYSYKQVFDNMQADTADSLAVILSDFAPGRYAISTNSLPVNQWQKAGDEYVQIETNGVGVWPVTAGEPIEKLHDAVSDFRWQNDHFEAAVDELGQVQVNGSVFGRLVVSADHGDTYSNEKGEQLAILQPTSPLCLIEKSSQHQVVQFDAAWETADISVSATVKLCFDQSPLIQWQIDLDSRGKDFTVEMVFDTKQNGQLYAGMPFDVVERPTVDTNLLPRQLDADLEDVLLGQRELNGVCTFPFHEFVAVGDVENTIAVLAKGIRSYEAAADGTIAIALRRSVEWLTAADLENRIGDAGPFFYVPDARCERPVRHELAVAFVADSPTSMAVQTVNAAYQNPPMIVQAAGTGTETSWAIVQENLPLATIHLQNGTPLARFYNPTDQAYDYNQSYAQTDVWGVAQGSTSSITAKQIQTVQLDQAAGSEQAAQTCDVTVLAGPAWRVGHNQGRVNPDVMAELQAKIDKRVTLMQETAAQHAACDDETEQLRLQHRLYVLEREKLEFELSHVLNLRKQAEAEPLRYGYLYEPDEEIGRISLDLNHLRVKRRIFDYVVQAL